MKKKTRERQRVHTRLDAITCAGRLTPKVTREGISPRQTVATDRRQGDVIDFKTPITEGNGYVRDLIFTVCVLTSMDFLLLFCCFFFLFRVVF